MAEFSPQQPADVLSNLFKVEEYQHVVAKILVGKKVDDKAFEQTVARAFIERSIVGLGGPGLGTNSQLDMYAKSLSLMGVNPKGKALVDDPLYSNIMIRELLPRALAETDGDRVISTDVSHALIRYMEAPEATKYPSNVKNELDTFLNEGRKKKLLNNVKNKVVSNPLTEESLSSLFKSNGVDGPEYVSLSNEVDIPNEKEPKLSDEMMHPDVLTLAADAEKEYLDHKISVDLQTDALMKINKIMDKNPDIVHRTVVNKLKDKITQGMSDFANPNHLIYPSESIFGETISKVDENGRVLEELFALKTSLILRQPKIEFKSKTPSEEGCKLAALHAMHSGIRYPHVGSTYRDPKLAIAFMKSTVDALISAGYNIDDISVDPHLRTAFEHHVSIKYSEKHTLSEAPEVLRENPLDPDLAEQLAPDPVYKERIQTDEELLAENKTKINGHVLKVQAAMSQDSESPLDFKDLNQEDMNYVLSLSPMLAQSSENWNKSIRELGISPSARPTILRIKAEFSKLIDLADPTIDTREIGSNELKILHGAKEVLPSAFADDKRLNNIDLASRAKNQKNQENPAAPDSTDEYHNAMREQAQEARDQEAKDNLFPPADKNNDNTQLVSNIKSNVNKNNPESDVVIEQNQNNEELKSDPTNESDTGIDVNTQSKDSKAINDTIDDVLEPRGKNKSEPDLSSFIDDEISYGEVPERLNEAPMPTEIPWDKGEDEQHDFMPDDYSRSNDDGLVRDDDFQQQNDEVWKGVSSKGWTDLSETEIRAIAELTPKQSTALLTRLLDVEGVDQRQVENNVKNVTYLLSEFVVDQEADVTQSEIDFLKKVPEDLLHEGQKKVLASQPIESVSNVNDDDLDDNNTRPKGPQ